jgi:hypothetical protein
VQVPKFGWHKFEVAQKAAELPQFPFTEQQFPKELPRHMAFTVEADPHFPSVETGVHVPKADWHRFVVPQKAGVLPQFPLTEQQFPNLLPLHVAPIVEDDPHFPSGEMAFVGVAVGFELVVLTLELVVVVAFVVVLVFKVVEVIFEVVEVVFEVVEVVFTVVLVVGFGTQESAVFVANPFKSPFTA